MALIWSSSPPRIAAIAPSPTGTADCIESPRWRSKRAASLIDRLPDAARAAYSPSEWPAVIPPRLASGAPSSASRTRTAAIDVPNKAGWAFRVMRMASSGPSCMMANRFSPSASLISSKTCLAAACDAAKAPPIPTACDPCPGNKNAIELFVM